MYYVNNHFRISLFGVRAYDYVLLFGKRLGNFKTLISPENIVLDIIIITTMEARPLTILLVYFVET